MRPLRVLATPARAPRPNPFNRLLTESLDALGGAVQTEEFSWSHALNGGGDLLHFHWPEYYLRSRKAPWLSPARKKFTLAGLRLIKRRGTRLMWTVHNLTPHGISPTRPWRPYQEFLALTDGLIHLSEASRRAFEDLYPRAAGVSSFVIPHGHYVGCYPDGARPPEARKRLGIPRDAIVACAVGSVEPYKNLTALVRECVALDRPDLWLLIAGKPSSRRLCEEISAAAASSERVRLKLQFVSDGEIQDYFAAADFCVLPYEETLNSGTAILALSFHTPVVCPAKGSLAELRGEVGGNWVMAYPGAFDGAVLSRAADWAESRRTDAPDISSMNWDNIAEKTFAAYRHVVRREPLDSSRH